MDLQKSKSVIVRTFGGYESLSVGDFELPQLNGNIEVKVEYGGLNFADLYTRQGLMPNRKLPFILGMECTGVISAIGSEILDTNFKVGQRVICYNYNGGMYRDTVRVKPHECFPLPDFIDLRTGAAVFVNYLTASFSLIELGNLKDDETVLILSCAGGVGSAATQIAKTIKGVKVFGTGSRNKEERVKNNGVDVFFPNETFKTDVKNHKFDVIVANQAGSTFEFLQSLLNPLGRIVLIGANNIIQDERKLSAVTLLKAWWTMKHIPPESLIVNNRAVAGLHLGTLLENNPSKVKKMLDYIFKLIEEKKLNPVIHSSWPMDRIVEATKLLAERKNFGKVLLCMTE